MIKKYKKSLPAGERGFTLIEVIVYLALFSILITGGISASFFILEGGDRNAARALLAEEGSFVIAKMRVSPALDVASLVGGRVQMGDVDQTQDGGLRFTLHIHTAKGVIVSQEFFSTISYPLSPL